MAHVGREAFILIAPAAVGRLVDGAERKWNLNKFIMSTAGGWTRGKL